MFEIKMDYPELEGKRVKFVGWEEYEKISAIVIGCSYRAGITIVDTQTKKHKMCCLNYKENRKDSRGTRGYALIFFYLVKCIDEGIIRAEEFRNVDPVYKMNHIDEMVFEQFSVMTPCAFE